MAGAGFKTFAVAEVLTAANVNTYLMQQSVMVFADASARSTAITSPSEGMVTYLSDSNTLWVYDGSAWIEVVTKPEVVNFAYASNTTSTLTDTQFTAVSLSYTPANGSNLLVIEASFTGLAIWDGVTARTPRSLSAKLRDTTNSTDLFSPVTYGRSLVATSTEAAPTQLPIYMRTIVTASNTTARTYAVVINGFTDVDFGVTGEPPNILSITEVKP
jgi:hypothetical protein